MIHSFLSTSSTHAPHQASPPLHLISNLSRTSQTSNLLCRRLPLHLRRLALCARRVRVVCRILVIRATLTHQPPSHHITADCTQLLTCTFHTTHLAASRRASSSPSSPLHLISTHSRHPSPPSPQLSSPLLTQLRLIRLPRWRQITKVAMPLSMVNPVPRHLRVLRLRLDLARRPRQSRSRRHQHSKQAREMHRVSIYTRLVQARLENAPQQAVATIKQQRIHRTIYTASYTHPDSLPVTTLLPAPHLYVSASTRTRTCTCACACACACAYHPTPSHPPTQ